MSVTLPIHGTDFVDADLGDRLDARKLVQYPIGLWTRLSASYLFLSGILAHGGLGRGGKDEKGRTGCKGDEQTLAGMGPSKIM